MKSLAERKVKEALVFAASCYELHVTTQQKERREAPTALQPLEEISIALGAVARAAGPDEIICRIGAALDARNQVVKAELLTPAAVAATALQRFVEDGRLCIDNNPAENQLRGIAIGRKNWLFAGSLEGAHRAALMYSLVQSCALAGVSPFDYLRDVLLRVATHPQSRIAELTPKGWAATVGRRAAA